MPRPEFRSNTEILESMIRVDHAGEYGAIRIYQGQMKATKDLKTKALISHMLEQEHRHLAFFEEEMRRRNVRPTALMPLWHYGSYGLGFIAALMGKKTAMLCTQAVEEVIDEHYAEQSGALKDNKIETKLYKTIEKFRMEELEHKETAIDHGSLKAPFYSFIRSSISGLCKLAINMSKK